QSELDALALGFGVTEHRHAEPDGVLSTGRARTPGTDGRPVTRSRRGFKLRRPGGRRAAAPPTPSGVVRSSPAFPTPARTGYLPIRAVRRRVVPDRGSGPDRAGRRRRGPGGRVRPEARWAGDPGRRTAREAGRGRVPAQHRRDRRRGEGTRPPHGVDLP